MINPIQQSTKAYAFYRVFYKCHFSFGIIYERFNTTLLQLSWELPIFFFFCQMQVSQSEFDLFMSNQKKEQQKLKETENNLERAEKTLKDRSK